MYARNVEVRSSRGVILGVRLLSIFFLFGFVMCAITVMMLTFPGSFLEPLWRLNPEAHRSFVKIGIWAVLLMSVVGIACLLSAAGLSARADWGRRLAIVVLTVNLLGDTTAALMRHDARTLIGLPIAGAMIFFLLSNPVRSLFRMAEL
jgi:hypothetical protein